MLDGGFLNSTTAVAVPKGHPEALAYVSAFVEEAKASGMVRKALDDMGLTSSQVAPAARGTICAAIFWCHRTTGSRCARPCEPTATSKWGNSSGAPTAAP